MASIGEDLPVFSTHSYPSPQVPTSLLRRIRRRFTISLLTFTGICLLFFWSTQIEKGPNKPLRQHAPPPLVILEEGPRPTVALTPLGLEAEEAYHLGSLSRHDYHSSLESFINITFPLRLRPQLKNSLDLFLKFESTEPRPEPPKIIWQTNDVLPINSKTLSWKRINKGHEYRFFNDEDGDEWVHRNFKGSPIQWAWDILPHPVMKADLLRYLLLLVEGGTYSDIDTTCLRPISRWGFGPDVHGPLLDSLPSAIVGIEADVGDRADWHTWWSRPIQIVQWTMTFSPGHPALLDTVRRIYAHSIENAPTMHEQHSVKKQSIINTTLEWTGPAVFTDAMLRYSLLENDLKWPDLRGLEKPLRAGTVTYLPVTGFSPGVVNFGAKARNDPQAMVYHDFKGSWKPKKGKGQ